MAMWEDLIKCFRKGAKIQGCTGSKIEELFHRVPPDQRKYLQQFSKKHDEYRQRVRKYPEKMPSIDWTYYRENVREEMVSWVNDYEKKYDRLDSMFGDRHTMIDYSKYFGELTQQTEEVKMEVKKFKEESEKRIVELQYKMKELEALRPYTEMTMEEFCIAHPNEAPDFRNKPTFWPHTPEEQAVDEEHIHAELEPKDKTESKDPTKPPPKTPTAPTATAPKDAKPEPPAKPKEVDSKELNKCEEEKGKVDAVHVEEKESLESKITDKVTDLASKGIDLVKELSSKAVVLFKGLWEKVEAKRKEVAKTADAERSKTDSTVKTAPSIDRGGTPEICNKTIIRGEQTTKPDIKDHHVDLSIEGDSDTKREKEDKCREACKAKEECEEELKKRKKCVGEVDEEDKCKEQAKDVITICFEKYQEENKAKESESCAEPPRVDVCKPKPKDDTKCQLGEKTSLTYTNIQDKPQTSLSTYELNQVPPSDADFNQDVKSSGTQQSNIIMGMHQEVLTAENEIFFGPKKQLPHELKDSTQPVGDMPSSIEVLDRNTKLENTVMSSKDNEGNKDDKSILDTKITEDSDQIAKVMFNMAIGAAKLLSEAKKNIEQVQLENAGQNEVLEEVYSAASEKINLALTQAHSALDSAKRLTHRAQSTLEADEQKLVATIEKHIVLAKLLANRATAMQKEITKLLNDLKK